MGNVVRWLDEKWRRLARVAGNFLASGQFPSSDSLPAKRTDAHHFLRGLYPHDVDSVLDVEPGGLRRGPPSAASASVEVPLGAAAAGSEHHSHVGGAVEGGAGGANVQEDQSSYLQWKRIRKCCDKDLFMRKCRMHFYQEDYDED